MPFPIEIKRGKAKLHRADEVQLCAQALCLEEMTGCPVPDGALFYAETKRRLPVAFDTELRQGVDPPDATNLATAGRVSADMENLPLRREAVVRPQTFKVDQRSLAQTIDRMLQGGERDGLGRELIWLLRDLHPSLKVLDDLDAVWQARPINRDFIVLARSWKFHPLFESYLYALEETGSCLISKLAVMLECN